ncbi:2-dehydropantoate 2-reductase [Gordonia sp. CPCC 205515]|uniref:ketopantoate reductase family protein n=1 Tax=Gordonia sp. CPCC 205515 TaxID=3140791 RepID=UPI003AF36710
MSIAIVGCGAMGSVYAGRLASAGHDVHMIGRSPDHVGAVAEHGLTVRGPDGERVVQVASAGTSPPAGPIDLVILAVKAADVPTAATVLPGLMGPSTVVLTMQNGLGSAESIADVVDADRLAVGIASGFGASVPESGVVHHNAMRAVRFGAYAGLALPAVETVAEAWRAAGFDAQAVEDIVAMQWEKLICNVAYSAPCALTGLTVGEVMDHDDVGPVSRAAAVEAFDVARAIGVGITVDDPIAHVRAFGASMPNAKPSALQDIEARRVSEIPVINGAVPRAAARIGRDAPVNDMLTRLVRGVESSWPFDGAQGAKPR